MLASHLAFSGIDQCCYPSPLQRVELSLETSMPWLILAGSGGVADLLSEVLERVSPAPPSPSPPAEGEGGATPSVDMRERVAEIVRSHFPGHGDLDKLVEQVTTSSTTSSFTYLLNGRIPTESQVTPKQSAAPLPVSGIHYHPNQKHRFIPPYQNPTQNTSVQNCLFHLMAITFSPTIVKKSLYLIVVSF